ncbi:WD40 repeat-like protein [Xylaria arbuscula]|nr:WD40 repeat-like protein [Xylaria arbuscula]
MFSRRKRRAIPIPSSEESSSLQSSTTSSKSLFSLSKTLSKTSIGSRSVDANVDDPKGALGLTLLFSPQQPQVDLILVHGLGGGSRKTWSKTAQLSHYWPQEWLSKDSAFEKVRIYTYGYNSDYVKDKDNCLNIHHFGKLFLGTIGTSPCFKNSRTRIIAIGHSMGGLVIKKAYLLAKQDPVYHDLATRFAAVYFLATPHRGADSAKLLKNLLRVAYDRTYIADLERNSGTIQVINDEFRHVSTGLELWSFYETQNMKMFTSPIVDPESAVLGYQNEKQIPMNADHRSICKFETPLDANYIILRNAIVTTISNLIPEVPRLDPKERRDRLKNLKVYLEIPGVIDDDLLSARESRMPTTCQWVSTKAAYTQWRDNDTGSGRILWIKGKPATGKSVLSGYIIDQLQVSSVTCGYFFFKHGDRTKTRLSHCLRSLAFQIASSNMEAGDAILELQADGIRLDHMDERALWRMLFLSCIFPVMTTRNYWVIDALDECSDPTVFFDTIITSIDEHVPLKILIMSRDTVNLEEGFLSMSPPLLDTVTISNTDTLSDLALIIRKKAEALRAVGPTDRASLEKDILDKSKGSFLWTVLVFKELLQCYSKKELDRVLEDIPRGMESLYRRTLMSMSMVTRGKHLAKAILVWAACAVRPMTIGELNGALTLDVDDTFPNLAQSIDALCGQLVVIDKFGRVQMIHETAREFLLSDESDSEFSLKKTQAHTRMARMKPPRTSRRRFPASTLTTRSDFAQYVHTSYSYHLSKADPREIQLFGLVDQFFKSNVLSWIEAISLSQDLNQLIRASKHLKTYLNACATERSPLDPRMKALRQWVSDLSRIPANYIYSLIPPFCPTNSMIYKIGAQGRRLTVIGALSDQWDDRLFCINFHQGQPSALCHGDEFLAVGLTSGVVALYYATSYQEHRTLDHGEPVKFISFKPKANIMATCGMRMVKVWDIRSGDLVWSLASPPRPLTMEFSGDNLLIACHKNYVASWCLTKSPAPQACHWSWSDKSEANSTPSRPPCALALSPSQGLLAVAYTGQPITIWDIEENEFAGNCGKRLSNGKTCTHVVVSLIFNPNPNIGLLAASYLDGDLALLDPFTNHQFECFRANCQTLAASANGRLLAAGGADGILHVYEFDTLKLLYRVKSSNSYIKQIGFSRNSLRLVDIRGAQCTVWEPEALLRDSLSHDSSESNQTLASTVETIVLGAQARVTTIISHPTSEVIFCGKDDGKIVLYDRKSALPVNTIHSHKSPIRILMWSKSRNAVLSVDASNRIYMHEVHKSSGQGWSTDARILFQSHLRSEKAIIDVLLGEEVDKFMVSTRESDHLFSLQSGEHEMEQTSNTPGVRKWLQNSRSPQQLVCISSYGARIYSWEDWAELGSFSLSFDYQTMELQNAFSSPIDQKQITLLELMGRNSWNDRTSIEIIDMDCLKLEGRDVTAPLERDSDIAHVIGVNEMGKFVFIDRSYWVCSADFRVGIPMEGQSENAFQVEIYRHFFIPYEWFAGAKSIVCAIVEQDIILTRGGELAIIRGAFEHAEKVDY